MQYLYIIKCQQFYKIGVAVDVENRLAQLSTGNPFPLEVEVVYAFDNAEIVERAIHQRYQDKRQRGEWFLLDYEDTKNIHSICLMLGGSASEYTGEAITEELVEEAEEISEPTDGGKWDYAAMLADGWYMERGNSKRGDWRWRSKDKTKFIYGGLLRNLPHPIEEMRRIYRDGVS